MPLFKRLSICTELQLDSNVKRQLVTLDQNIIITQLCIAFCTSEFEARLNQGHANLYIKRNFKHVFACRALFTWPERLIPML